MADEKNDLEQLASSSTKPFDKAGFLKDIQNKYRICFDRLRLDLVSGMQECTEIAPSNDVVEDAYSRLAVRTDIPIDAKLRYFSDIHTITSVAPKSSHAQKFYENCLEQGNLDILNSFNFRFDIDPKPGRKATDNAYLILLKKQDFVGIGELYDLTYRRPPFSKGTIAKCYDFLFSIDKVFDAYSLYISTGVRPRLERARVDALFNKYIRLEQVHALQRLKDVTLLSSFSGSDISSGQAVAIVNRLMKPVGATYTQCMFALKELTKVKPRFSGPQVQQAYLNLAVGGLFDSISELKGITGIKPVFSDSPKLQDAYDSLKKADFMEWFERLSDLTGVEYRR